MECEKCKYATSCQYFDFCIAEHPEYETDFYNSIFSNKNDYQGYNIKKEYQENYFKKSIDKC